MLAPGKRGDRMPIDRRVLIGAGLGLTLSAKARARGWSYGPADTAPDRPAWPPADRFALWPGRPPNALTRLPISHDTMNGAPGQRELWLRGIAEPYVAVYRPRQPDGSAALVVPGGGYNFLSIQNEGINAAHALNERGITAFVLVYRLPAEGWAHHWDVPLQDAQRAMRLIRSHAAHWEVDPARLGVLGFSAGGHLGASLAVGYNDPVYHPVDASDHVSARPAFAGLLYPVITISFDRKGGSYTHLIGPNPEPGVIARYETDRRVTRETPPLFLAQALDDKTVSPQNTLNMLAAARAAHVPVEMHLFESGGHGFGTARHMPELPASRWPELFSLWMRRHIAA
jgi:acetyl esterase/lipase